MLGRSSSLSWIDEFFSVYIVPNLHGRQCTNPPAIFPSDKLNVLFFVRTKQMRTLLYWNEVFLIRGKNWIRTGIYGMPNGHTVVALHTLRVLFIQNQTTILPLVRIRLTKPPAVIVDWYFHDEHNNHINSMYFLCYFGHYC